MKARITIINLFLVLILTDVSAQTDVDAIRYSGSSIAGTARFVAMGGAFGAIGGDFTTLSHNPAGIGIYRSSEFTFSPSIYSSSTTSNFLGRSFQDSKTNFNIPNIGVVYTYTISRNVDKPGWKSWNFGVGYNRLENFHRRSFYEGLNPSNSLLDHYAEQSNGSDPSSLDPFNELLAYNTYLTNPDASLHYTGVIPAGQEIQQRTFESNGAIGETVFTFGGNYSNKLFLGTTIGIKSLRYVEYSVYEEFDPDTQIANFKAFKLNQDLTTHGTGFNMKFGMIFKPNDAFRFGVAIHTPTWYGMHDDFVSRMTAVLDNDSVAQRYDEAIGEFSYDLTTPFKAIGSVAFIFGKHGLVSADYEYTDNGEARLYAGGISFGDVNTYIGQKYTGVHLVKIGTEWIYENFSFRGGFAMSTSPLKEIYRAGDSDFSKQTFTLGIGYRENGYFFDFGYAQSFTNEYFQKYTLNDPAVVPGVKSRVIDHNFTATFGVKF